MGPISTNPERSQIGANELVADFGRVGDEGPVVKLDPTPWLLLSVPFLAATLYFFSRGLRKSQFRVPGTSGWAHYPNGSLDWWTSTLVNAVFVCSALFMVYESLFHGSEFSREPQLPMPSLAGTRVESTRVPESAQMLAACLADLNHGQVYPTEDGGRRVAVRNGRNTMLYTFDIAAGRDSSRLDVYRVQYTPLVRWKSCTTKSEAG
ncbi:MAG: hypothetical protein ACTHJR_20375 [Sphingomonas sp.]|uniref:hypothetical protein n=1 Tax=Sphingomonas sp. TaxID=28214 RepID=UPI003F7E89D8